MWNVHDSTLALRLSLFDVSALPQTAMAVLPTLHSTKCRKFEKNIYYIEELDILYYYLLKTHMLADSQCILNLTKFELRGK
jgi:hypothetical protein